MLMQEMNSMFTAEYTAGYSAKILHNKSTQHLLGKVSKLPSIKY